MLLFCLVNQIKYIIAGDDDDEVIELGKHPLFTQMDVLCHFDDGRIGWKQISRYKQVKRNCEQNNVSK